MEKIIIGVAVLAFVSPFSAHADNGLATVSAPDSAGLLVVGRGGQAVIANHANQPFIPASTTKLVTAWLALYHWGEDYRFRTDFFLDTVTNTLWVKGSGDPFLVSEALNLIAGDLKRRGLQQINSIGLDASLFQPNLVLPGTTCSNNPYDAMPSAIAANFNTVKIFGPCR